MNLCDLAPEYIHSIAPYQPGKPISELAREIGLDESSIIKLASNENPLGTSPLALEAMENYLAGVKKILILGLLAVQSGESGMSNGFVIWQ